MEETVKGLHVKDYTDLDPNALQEIIELDSQLNDVLKDLLRYTNELDYTKLRRNLRWLIMSNISHRDYAQRCLDDMFVKMECNEVSTHMEYYMNEPQ